MIRSALLLAAAALAAGLIVGVRTHASGGLETGALLLVAGGLGLAAAHVAVRRRRRLRLPAQFAVAVAVAIGCLLAALVAGAELMFVSREDAELVAVIAVFAGVVAVRAAGLLAAGVLSDVERLRDGLALVGTGRRDVPLAIGGADELSELADEAQRMETSLAGEERARRLLVAAVSHDLRTPVASLRLLVEAVQEGVADGPERERYLASMGTHVAALSALIDDLFELTRLEAGDIAWTVGQVPLADLLGETVAALRVDAERKGVALAAEVAPALGPARGNADKLQRVLLNLVQNAIRHTPADGSVTVRAQAAAEGIAVEVADTGAGIAAEDLLRIFEPFARGDGGGVGLGLAIARAIVEAHGGRIWVDPAEAGARVRFTVPAAG